MRRPILNGLIAAAVMLAAAALIKYAQNVHLIGADSAARAINVVIGLFLAVWSNFIPKTRVAANGGTVFARRMQSALRAGGWLFVIAGLIYATAWAFAPRATADLVSTSAVVVAIIASLGSMLWACAAREKRVARPTSS